jgi:hypothetical protein
MRRQKNFKISKFIDSIAELLNKNRISENSLQENGKNGGLTAPCEYMDAVSARRADNKGNIGVTH